MASTRPETASSRSIWAHALSQSAIRRSNLCVFPVVVVAMVGDYYRFSFCLCLSLP